jgi:hypothetical protein
MAPKVAIVYVRQFLQCNDLAFPYMNSATNTRSGSLVLDVRPHPEAG